MTPMTPTASRRVFLAAFIFRPWFVMELGRSRAFALATSAVPLLQQKRRNIATWPSLAFVGAGSYNERRGRRVSVFGASTSQDYYSAVSRMSTRIEKSQRQSSGVAWVESEDHLIYNNHIAHVILPQGAMMAGNVVQRVLDFIDGEKEANNSTLSKQPSREKSEMIRLRVDAEWHDSEVPSTLRDLEPGFRSDSEMLPQTSTQQLTAHELFALGSVWYLPLNATKPGVDRFDSQNGVKPKRLTVGAVNMTVQGGDYLRVHFDPRRFCVANSYDWLAQDGMMGSDNKPGVVVERNDEMGYMILSKPRGVPIHARVDNHLENVAARIGRMLWQERKQDVSLPDRSIQPKENVKRKRRGKTEKKQHAIYVATPQRLDQNTSGLVAVATKKCFAAYFAELLRKKTSAQLSQGGSSRSEDCRVHKAYRCLVCISPSAESSMASEVKKLRDYGIMRHYLEPSIRAPKRFLADIPHYAESAAWAECLLKITRIGRVCTVVGNAPSETLSDNLWGGKHGRPKGCIGVCELEIELLTGRTHQIRGQLAAEGFPLVGDVQYGGAIAQSTAEDIGEPEKRDGFLFLGDSEELCLQCCSLEFLEPHLTVDSNGAESMTPSQRWKKFSLSGSSWTDFLDEYSCAELSSESVTSSLLDEEPLLTQQREESHHAADTSTQNELPPAVLLSEGKNKYVAVRARRAGQSFWFVRSASPAECGGPYHANVAEDLLHRLETLGFSTQVEGGGRIDCMEGEGIKHAHVYGFSYGFGKGVEGDHEKVAEIIEQNSDYVATYDNSDGLY